MLQALASWKVLKNLAATGWNYIARTLVFRMKLISHLEAVAWLVATKGSASKLKRLADPTA